MTIAPGAQPRLVDSAATRNVRRVGRRQRERLADVQVVFGGDRLARGRASRRRARVRRPRRGSPCSELGRGQQRRRRRAAGRSRGRGARRSRAARCGRGAPRARPGGASSLGLRRAGTESCSAGRRQPAARPTRRSDAFMSLRGVFEARRAGRRARPGSRRCRRPRSRRSPRSPRRARAAAPSSIAATCGTGLVIARASRSTSASVAPSTSGSSSSSAATQQHHPGIAASRRGEQDRGRGGEARQPGERRAACRPRAAAGALDRARRSRPRERIAREDVAQRAEHRHDRREHPARDRDRDALPADDALRADRERQRQERRVGVQAGGSRAPRRAPDPSTHAIESERERVEQQHRDHGPRRVPVAAQIGDQPPALRDGQQHRVEREQEPDERADHREQRGRLVARRGRLGEQRRVVVDRLDVQAPRGERLQSGSHARLARAGRGLLRGCGSGARPDRSFPARATAARCATGLAIKRADLTVRAAARRAAPGPCARRAGR